MDSSRTAYSPIAVEGLSAGGDDEFLAASLRYFDLQGSFAAILRNAVGAALPEPLRVIRSDPGAIHAPFLLVWRGPTATLLLTKNQAEFARLEGELAAAADGCMVDQTGGVCVIRVRGRRTEDLLARLGSDRVIPGLGEALTGRLAELQVTAIRADADEVLLLVERVYADHLLEWIAVTARDF